MITLIKNDYTDYTDDLDSPCDNCFVMKSISVKIKILLQLLADLQFYPSQYSGSGLHFCNHTVNRKAKIVNQVAFP